VGPYSQAIVSGKWVYASGQIPGGTLVDGDIDEQTEQVLRNLAVVLEAAGSSLAQVVKTTVFMTDLTDFPRMNEVYARHLGGDVPPARSTVQVSALPLGALVEIDCIARR
jgi:2-iminobutanoate/2-iminopropanoate deaminase